MTKKLDYLVWGNPQLGAKNKKVFVDKYTQQNPSVKTSIILRDYKFLADAVIEMVKRNEGVDIDIPTAFSLIGMSDYRPEILLKPIAERVGEFGLIKKLDLYDIYVSANNNFARFFNLIKSLSEHLNRMQMDWVAKIVRKAVIFGIKDLQSKLIAKNDKYNDLKNVFEEIMRGGADFMETGGVLLPRTLGTFFDLEDHTNFYDLWHSARQLIHAFEIAKLNDFNPILQYNFSNKSAATASHEILELEKQMATLVGSDFGNPMEAEDAGEPVVKFSDGLAWYRIRENYSKPTAKALGHCGNEHHPGDSDEVWNLGKKMKDGRVRPALTFIVTMPKGGNTGGIVGEMKGGANSTPGETYHKYIYGLFESPYIGYILGGGHDADSNFNPDRDFKDEYKTKWRSLLTQKPYLRKAFAYRGKFGEAYYEVLSDEAFDDWKFYNDNRGRDPHGWDQIPTYYDETITRFFKDYKPWSQRRTKTANPVIEYIELLTSDSETQHESFSSYFGYIPKFSWAKFGEGISLIDQISSNTPSNGVTLRWIKDAIIKQLSTRYDSGMLNAKEKSLVYKAINFVKNDLWDNIDKLSFEANQSSYTIEDYLPEEMIKHFNASVFSGYFDGTLYNLELEIRSYCTSVFENLPGKVDWELELESGDDGGDVTWDTSETGEENCADGFSASDIDEYAHEQGRFHGPSHDSCYSPVDVTEYEADFDFMAKVSLTFNPRVVARYFMVLDAKSLETLTDAWAQKRIL